VVSGEKGFFEHEIKLLKCVGMQKGLAARGFPELWRLWLRRRLGRGWADALLATHNLNLEETHTARVIAFVDAADAELAMKPRVVSAPISEQKAA
jgi:hypothetical protein